MRKAMEYRNRRFQEHGLAVQMLSRPSRWVVYEKPAVQEAAPQKKTSVFSSFALMLSRLRSVRDSP